MILSNPATDAAFIQLTTALDAEVKGLNAIGTKVAIQGVPRNATRVMNLAGARAKLRDHIVFLHQQWKQPEPMGINSLQVELPQPTPQITPSAKRMKSATCIHGERACPPEDCGSVPGYEELCEALPNPKHPEHAHWKQWIGAYDPDRFVLDDVNLRLSLVRV